MKRMNIVEYVNRNYAKLPKSSFNNEEVVVVLEIRNDDEGYGNHSYEGVGVTGDGKVVYCFSSGCSCRGECGISEPHGHDMTTKKWKETNFQSIQVEFNDY